MSVEEVHLRMLSRYEEARQEDEEEFEEEGEGF